MIKYEKIKREYWGFYEKIEFAKAKRSDIDESVDMFRYTIEETSVKGIPQWDEIYLRCDDLLHDTAVFYQGYNVNTFILHFL